MKLFFSLLLWLYTTYQIEKNNSFLQDFSWARSGYISNLIFNDLFHVDLMNGKVT